MKNRMAPLRPPIFSFYCQWPELFHPSECNWLDFTFLNVACEYDKVGAHFEVGLALLGFALTITIPTGDTEQSRHVAQQYKAAKAPDAPKIPMLEVLKKISAETGVPIENIMAPPGFFAGKQ